MDFLELGFVLFFAFLFSYIASQLKQPPLLGYIIAGIISSMYFTSTIQDLELFENFSHIGIAFLLFTVGTHLKFDDLKANNRLLFAGLIQIIVTFAASYFLFIFLAIPFVTSLMLSIAVALSSTIVIIKILGEQRQLDETYSKVVIAILILQDIFAILCIIFLTSFTQGVNVFLALTDLILKGSLGIALLYLLYKIVITKLLDSIARSQELLFLFSISFCFVIAALAKEAGFSLEIGALIAGMVLSASPYQSEISARIQPLKDFFLVVFFFLLGYNIQTLPGRDDIYLIVLLLLLVFVLKPIIIYYTVRFLKYTKGVAFLTAISMGQVSEFTLIFLTLALQYDLVAPAILNDVTIAAVISMGISSYLIVHNMKIFNLLIKYGIVNYNMHKSEPKNAPTKAILMGFGRIGHSLFGTLKKHGKDYLVIDHNPDVIKRLKHNGVSCFYGDAKNIDLLHELNLTKTEVLISTLPSLDHNLTLIQFMKKTNPRTYTIVTARQIEEASTLYNAGADYVIMPYFLGGEYIAALLEKYHDNVDELLKEKIKHIQHLQTRKYLGMEHPHIHKD